MNIILKKKKTLYFFSIITIVAICMMEPFFIVNDKTYSFIDTIKKIPPSEYSRFCIQDVFSFGSSSLWLYLIMPVVVATPLVSYISDEQKSMFHLYEKMRQGTPRYFGFRLFYSLMSSGIIVFIGLGIYLLVVCCYFDLYKVYPGGVMDIGGEGQGISELVRYFTVKFGYLVVYSFSISLLASFLVLLYNDLYFDLSVTFMLNYLFKDWFLKNNILYPLIIAAVLIILFMIKWKRGRKI